MTKLITLPQILYISRVNWKNSCNWQLKENDDSNRQRSPICEDDQNCHMQTNNYSSEGEEVHSFCSKVERSSGDPKGNQLVIFGDPLPLQINEACGYDELEDKATLWVHSNVFKLSQHYRKCFTGCERLALDMLRKIDLKRFLLNQIHRRPNQVVMMERIQMTLET